MNDAVNIHFLGAAGMVTGSKYLVELPEKNHFGGLRDVSGRQEAAPA